MPGDDLFISSAPRENPRHIATRPRRPSWFWPLAGALLVAVPGLVVDLVRAGSSDRLARPGDWILLALGLITVSLSVAGFEPYMAMLRRGSSLQRTLQRNVDVSRNEVDLTPLLRVMRAALGAGLVVFAAGLLLRSF